MHTEGTSASSGVLSGSQDGEGPSFPGKSVEVLAKFLDENSLASLPSERLKALVRGMTTHTAIAKERIGELTLVEKAALIAHPVFMQFIRVIALEAMFKLQKPSPGQLAAMRFLASDFKERQAALEAKEAEKNKPKRVDPRASISVGLDEGDDE